MKAGITKATSDGNITPTSDKGEKKNLPPPRIPDDLIYPIIDEEGKETPVIDIGANLTKACFKDNIPAILGRASKAGVTHIIITGTNYNSSRQALRICHEYDGIEGITLRCTIGIHPLEADYTMTGQNGKYSTIFADSLERLLTSEWGQKYCVAIGECGLDYSRLEQFEKEKVEQYVTHQKHVFQKQLGIAGKHKLPVFCHSRDSHNDFLEMIKLKKLAEVKVVVHCHTDPSVKNLKEFLRVGAYIGLTGVNSDMREGRFNQEIMKEIPLNRLMVETDAPYLFPRNLYDFRDHRDRFKWLNEPCMVTYVIDKIRQVRGKESECDIANKTTAVAKAFFGL